MDSLVGSAVHYCCVWNGKKKIHSQNNGDLELEHISDLCLENIPSLHLWCSRTVKGRTYGFLMEEGITYFAIADSSIGSSNILLFLQNLRDGYKKSLLNGFMEELVPIVHRLVASLEGLPRQSTLEQITEEPSLSGTSASTKMPLLGRSASKQDGRKMSIRTLAMDGDEGPSMRRIGIDEPPEVGGFSLQKGTSSNRSRNQLIGHRLWLQQVKIVVAIDVLVCVVLLAVWLAICKGFNCIR